MMNDNDAKAMFGCSMEAMETMMKEQVFGDDALMLAMAILSDAQHVLEGGNSETARQYMNRAKYVIAEVKRAARKSEMKI